MAQTFARHAWVDESLQSAGDAGHYLLELQALGVTRVWMERRTAALDPRDMEMIDALRARRVIGSGLTVDTALPDRDPLLWLPDIVAGAVGLDRRGGDPVPYRALPPKITAHEVVLS